MIAPHQRSHRVREFTLVASLTGSLALAALLGGCPPTSVTPSEPNNTNSTTPTTPGGSTGSTNNPPTGSGGQVSNEQPPANPPDPPASFALHVTITGQGAVNPMSGSFAVGANVTLSAAAATGWRFDHWEGDVTGSANPATVAMPNADLAVTAVFVQIAGAPMSFYAVYDWVTDDEQMQTGIDRVAISADASKVFFANADGSAGHRKAYSMNPDGSGLVTYNLPNAGPYGTSGVVYLVVNHDGSRAFAVPRYDRAIFKLENGAVTTYSVDRPQGPSGVDDPGINAEGTTVWFREVYKIWSLDLSSGNLQVVAEVQNIPARGGRGEALGDMAVAADGTLAFILYVRNSQNNTLSTEIFCIRNGGARQLTDDRRGIMSKGTGITISADGSTLVYLDSVQGKYIAIGSDGNNSRSVAPVGINAINRCLTHDGRKFIYADGGANGGRIVHTDGSGQLDLFPGWNVMTMTIGISGPLSISADGQHLAFRFEYAQWPFKRCIYVGHLNDAAAVAGAPRIESVSFSPGAMPRNDPNAEVQLLARLSDSDGDIQKTQLNSLINNAMEGNSVNVPVYFSFAPLDDGRAPDATAGDGIYTAVGRPGGKVNDYPQAVIRLGVRDAKKRITIADVPLPVGP